MSSNLRVVRGGHRRTATKLINKYIDSLITDIDDDEINSTIEVLKQKKELLERLNGEIEQNTLEEEIDTEIEEADRYTLLIIKGITKLKRLSKSCLNPHADAHVLTPVNTNFNNGQTSLSSSGINHSSSFHKLPKLSISKFDGNLLNWQSFWDSFEGAIDRNDLLTNSQKFNYLKSHLIEEASQCIAGLQLTNANYPTAIQLLKERFGQDHKLVNTFMKNLAEIQAPTSGIDSLKLFYDKMESYVRGLESLGRYPESYGSILVPTILGKLPQEMRRNITRDNGGDDWHFNSVRKAIQKEFSIQDASIISSVSDELTPTAAFVTKTQRGSINNKWANNITTRPCVFCDGVHAPFSCNKVTEVNERKQIVKEKELCFNCFRKHRVSDCKSKNTCRKCKRKHHTSICTVGLPMGNHERNNATEKQVDTSVMHSTSEITSSQVLLKTAIAPVSSDNGNRIGCNILFDEGAQRTFIRQQFANTLHYKSLGIEELHITGFGGEKLVRHLEKINISVYTHDNQKVNVEAVIVPDIAAPIEMKMQEVYKLPYIRRLKLAHYMPVDEKFEVQLLIGADFYWNFVQDKVIRGSGPTAVKSKLGYLLSGPVHKKLNVKPGNSTAMLNILLQRENVECDLKKFWKLESLGVSSEENDECMDMKMKNYQDTHIYFQDNRYYAKLPWKVERRNFRQTKILQEKEP